MHFFAKKKRKNNRLFLILVWFFLTAILLSTSTYAWFTANKTVNIDTIDVKVSTSSGLQISADGEEWKTVLTKEDLENASVKWLNAKNQLPDEMAPVSTAKEVDGNGRLKMFFGDVYADLTPGSDNYGEYVLESSLLSDLEADGAEGKYIAFDVFLKSGNIAKDLYMSGNVVEIHEVPDPTDPSKTIWQEITDPTQESGIANAARVGVIKGGNTQSTDVSTIRGLTTVGGKAYIWEPNFDYHTDNGIANGTSLGWINNGSTTHVAGNGGSIIAYDGLYAPTTQAIKLSNVVNTDPLGSAVAKPVAIDWSSQKGQNPISLKFPDTAHDAAGNDLTNGVTKFRIYMWVEGQDIDAENYASGTHVEYSLSFSLEEIQANP